MVKPCLSEELSRGEAARLVLIDAATEVFGRQGIGAARTRSIAEAAGVNQAMISYYFGGKRGLYNAVVAHIVEKISARVGPVVAEVREALGGGQCDPGEAAPVSEDPRHYLTLVQRIMDPFLELMTSRESAAWARVILREQQEPTPAFDILYDGIIVKVVDAAALAIGRRWGRFRPNAVDRLTALTIIGQALVFRSARAAVARQMGWNEIAAEELKLIKATVRRNLAAMFRLGE